MAKAATARTRRTKAEVQQEFDSIRKEVTAEREANDARAQEVARVREAEVRQALEHTSIDGIVGEISTLGLHVSKALSELSARLVGEVERLTAVREAVEIERRELQRLHKIDIAATALGPPRRGAANQNAGRARRPAGRAAGGASTSTGRSQAAGAGHCREGD